MADKITVKCPECKEARTVSKSMRYHYKAGRCSKKCKSCAATGRRRAEYPKELYQSRIYKVWTNMKSRCYNKNTNNYDRYGGRGVRVCDKWQKFAGFIDDMLESYESHVRSYGEEKTTIERVNNDKDYTPSNCRWATPKEQANNTKHTEDAITLSYGGEEKTVKEWAEEVGIKRTTLDMRVRHYGWPVEKALTTPVNK